MIPYTPPLNSRETRVVLAVDRLVQIGLPRDLMREVAAELRQAWQYGFEATERGECDIMRDADQLQRAVIAGIRCYRSHHPNTRAAEGLTGFETSSLAKRIVGNLKSLANGSGFVQVGSRSQDKHARQLQREHNSLG